MISIIESYYSKSNTPQMLIKQRLELFEKHPDIKEEFEEWIVFHCYRKREYVTVEGYSAKALSEMSEYLNGEGAFMLLIELRDNPIRALQRIKRGFVVR